MLPSVMPVAVEEPRPIDHYGRVAGLVAATIIVVLALAARLWVLSVVRFATYEQQASHNRIRLEPTDAPRGGIFDRGGQLLAGNRLAPRVVLFDLAPRHRKQRHLNPAAVLQPFEPFGAADLPTPTVADQLASLAALLQLSADELETIRAALADPQRPRFAPVVVRDDVDPVALCQIEEQRWRLPLVAIERVPLRSYPAGAAVAHLTGYVGAISPSELTARRAEQDRRIAELQQQVSTARRSYRNDQLPQLQRLLDQLAVAQRLRSRIDSQVGKTGLESCYEALLTGEPGLRTWKVNARNEPVELLSTTTGEAGRSLVLNCDLTLQKVAARRMAGRRGSVVALDPRDGAVLALYSSPSFDPQAFVPRISSTAWADLVENPAHPLQNRATRCIFAPGSTFKLVTAAAGLKAGAITARTGAVCGGGMKVGSMFKRCWQTHGGGIDLQRALTVSCDVFFYQAALKMGPDPIRAMAESFGLGRPTGIDLPGEAAGRLPTDEWHHQHHRRDWYAGDTANISIGQGDIAASTLQMAQVTAAVANGGRVYRPQVVRSVRTRDGRTERPWKPELVRRLPLAPEHLERIRRGLRGAVQSGTARPVALPTIAVAGKTGSAEDPPRRLPHAWFVCFAPFEAPQIVVAVMVENAGHGGENGGPVARALLEQYFAAKGLTP